MSCKQFFDDFAQSECEVKPHTPEENVIDESTQAAKIDADRQYLKTEDDRRNHQKLGLFGRLILKNGNMCQVRFKRNYNVGNSRQKNVLIKT